jgi:hypothetical protein
MRGIPHRPVTCIGCSARTACRKDALCHRCRIMGRPNARKKYFWTTTLDAMLRRAYMNAQNRVDLTAALDHIQRISGFTRFVIVAHAKELGLSFCEPHPWSPVEIAFLQEHMGSLSRRAIAVKLGRTSYSVKGKASRLDIRLRVLQGYSREDLSQLLGTGIKQVRRWIQSGWIKEEAGRTPERSIAAFLRRHPEQYRLSRVDDAWYKGLLFPSFSEGRSAKIRISPVLDRLMTQPPQSLLPTIGSTHETIRKECVSKSERGCGHE